MKKKALIMMLAMVMLLSCLAGCGGSGEGASSDGQRTVDEIKERGKLKVGCKSDTVNIGMLDAATGMYEGYDIDVAYAVAGKIFGCTMEEARERELVEFTSVTAKTRGGLLDNGELDCVIASFTITDERAKSWNFTQQYRLEPVSFLVQKSAGVATLEDMDGFIIGVGQGTTTADLIEAYAAAKDIKADYTIQDFNYISDGVAALKTGQIDAYSVDRMALAAYMDDTLMLTNDIFGVQEIGIALKKGNDELTKYMDDALTELKDSGELDSMKAVWGILTDAEVEAME